LRAAFSLQDQQTPLHLAVWGGSLDVIRFLIERGCPVDVEAKVRGSRVPYIDCFSFPHSWGLCSLTKRGCVRVLVAEQHAFTPLQMACRKVGLPPFCPLLLLLTLSVANAQGSLETVRLLIEEFKADPHCTAAGVRSYFRFTSLRFGVGLALGLIYRAAVCI
jgi:hypothetical protein